MHIQVVSKGIDTSEALRERVSERLSQAVAKYSHRPGEAYVAIAREGSGFKAECTLHLPSGALLRAEGFAQDAYGAADLAMEHIEKRLRRYKRRLVDHRSGRAQADAPAEPAVLTVLQAAPLLNGADLEDDDAWDAAADKAGDEPIVIAETTAELRSLTVGMAVLEMGLTDAPALIFRNVAHGGLNVVYRRPDGHIGWMDPARGRKADGG